MEKYIGYNINNNLIFIDNFQFLSSLLDSLLKNLSKANFNYLSKRGFKQKVCYPYGYMSDFEMFKEQLPKKGKFHSFLTDEKINDNRYERVLKIWNTFQIKTILDYQYFIIC